MSYSTSGSSSSEALMRSESAVAATCLVAGVSCNHPQSEWAEASAFNPTWTKPNSLLARLAGDQALADDRVVGRSGERAGRKHVPERRRRSGASSPAQS